MRALFRKGGLVDQWGIISVYIINLLPKCQVETLNPPGTSVSSVPDAPTPTMLLEGYAVCF